MSRQGSDEDARFIWATRGRTWGFRFLRAGGFDDPLRKYETAFSGLENEPEVWRRTADSVALRFPDPDRRSDAAGRIIPHDFVLIGRWADEYDSLEDGREKVWSLVSDEFDVVWDRQEPPSAPRDVST